MGRKDNRIGEHARAVGPIYQQTFLDTYSKVGFAKLHDRKTPITAADLLNDRVLPFFEKHEVVPQRVLTDRGTEYTVGVRGTDKSCTWRCWSGNT